MAAATPWSSTSAAAATASSSVVRAMSVVWVVTFRGTVSVRTWVRTLREGRWWATRLGGASLVVF